MSAKARPDGPRDPLAGPESGPERPYPIKLQGPVIKGFGRGSRELGIPTANIPPSGLDAYPDLESGVYFGSVGLKVTRETRQVADNSALTLGEAGAGGVNGANAMEEADGEAHGEEGGVGVYPAVLSIGYNPFYANPTRSIEIHILRHFPTYNFYHSALNLLILGFIRPEYDYKSLEDLVSDIKTDCEVARRSLARKGYQGYTNVESQEGKWLREFGWSEGMSEEDVRRVEEVEVGKGSGAKAEGKDGGSGAGQEKL